MSCEVLSVCSIKGGVGKTTTVANLGAVLSRKGKKVLVIDGNFSVPNLGIHFGYIDVGATIHDVLSRGAEAVDATYSYSSGLDVMPGLVHGKFIPRWSLARVIEEFRDRYDFILIDTSPSMTELDKALEVSDGVIFVATPDYPTISSTLQLIEDVRGRVVIKGIILNMVKGKSFELSAREVADASEVSVLGSVPYKVGVQRAVSEFRPYCLGGRWNRVYRGYNSILSENFLVK